MKRKDEHAELDALLNSEAQQTIKRTVASLPEESLSLAWRSSLNERLRQVSPVPRWRTRLAAGWRPALALALTGCLAMVLMIRTSPISNRSDGNLEASFVTVYFDSANSDEVAGSGLALHEVNDTTGAIETSDGSESDPYSL